MPEVVTQLTSLEAFRWCCPVFPVPAGVFQALKRLDKLTALHVDMSARRGATHCCEFARLLEVLATDSLLTVPFWELTSQLQYLSLRLCDGTDPDWIATIPEKPVEEDTLASFELPSRLPASPAEINALHESIACRTIVAAARAGRLKGLEVVDTALHQPFAVRGLLPFWVGVAFDDPVRYPSPHHYPDHKWLSARASLRPTLAHASLWLPSAGSLSRSLRLLTADDVKGLAAHFTHDGTPRVVQPEFVAPYEKATQPRSIKIYLDWLAEDAQLSQQVADAWNKIVERGEADLVKCRCNKCQPGLDEVTSPEYMLADTDSESESEWDAMVD